MPPQGFPNGALQVWRRLPCSQKLDPPHALQMWRRLPCSQKLDPPHALQFWRCLPCSHFFLTRFFTGCGDGGGGASADAEDAGSAIAALHKYGGGSDFSEFGQVAFFKICSDRHTARLNAFSQTSARSARCLTETTSTPTQRATANLSAPSQKCKRSTAQLVPQRSATLQETFQISRKLFNRRVFFRNPGD